MSLDSIVDVSIVNTTVSVSQAGFGIPLIVDYNTRFSVDRVRYYTSLLAMAADGFLTTDYAYKAAQACFAQNPRPTKVGIGRRLTVPTQTMELTPTAQNSRAYSVTINGTLISITSDSSATVAEITAALTTAINGSAVAAAVTATDNTTKLTIVSDVAGQGFSCVPSSNLALQLTTADAGIATDLADFLLASKDWYAVCLTSNSKAEILAAAAWVEANKRLMLVQTQDADALTSGSSDVAGSLKTAAYFRTHCDWHQDNSQFMSAAYLGRMLPEAPGSATWLYKTLAGIDSSSSFLTDTQQGNLETKNAGYYSTIAGLNLTLGAAKVASGEYLDVVIGLDWLRARLQEAFFALLAGAKKVPFTKGGQAMVEATLSSVLQSAVNAKLLAPNSIVISIPDLASISTADKANRLLPNVQFSATLAGAIHALKISGSVSV